MTAFDQMRRNRDVLFFLLNGLGWAGWGIAQAADTTLFGTLEPRYVLVIALAVGAGILISTPLRYICRVLWRQRPPVLLAGGLMAAYAAALPMRAVSNLAVQHFVEPDLTFNHWY